MFWTAVFYHISLRNASGLKEQKELSFGVCQGLKGRIGRGLPSTGQIRLV